MIAEVVFVQKLLAHAQPEVGKSNLARVILKSDPSASGLPVSLGMNKKLNDWEYQLTFSYTDDADLDEQIYDLLQEIEMEADLRCCFTEADVSDKGTERSW